MTERVERLHRVPVGTMQTLSAKALRRPWAPSQRVVALTARGMNFSNWTRRDNVIEVLKAWAISTGGRGTSNHTEGMRTTADRFGAK